MRIKQNLGIRKDLTKLNWSKMLNRMDTVWSPLQENWIKCNFDGCSKGKPRQAIAGGLFRNHKGDCIVGFGVNMGIFSNNKVEAMDALRHFNTLKEPRYKNVILEGDSKLIVDILNEEAAPPWELKNIIDRCNVIKKYFNNCKVQHVYREGNKATDCAANVALSCRGWTCWTSGNMLKSLRDLILRK